MALAALLLSAASVSARGEESLALIVSASSPIARLELIEVRKMYLGFTVVRGGLSLRAFENHSDERLHEVFLQNVVGMPDEAYQRRLLMSTLQQGGQRPRVYTSTADLLNAIAADPSAVSVAWTKDVAGDHRVKVLRILWRE